MVTTVYCHTKRYLGPSRVLGHFGDWMDFLITRQPVPEPLLLPVHLLDGLAKKKKKSYLSKLL